MKNYFQLRLVDTVLKRGKREKGAVKEFTGES